MWAWKKDTPPLNPKDQQDLIAAGKMAREESPFRLQDAASGNVAGGGTVATSPGGRTPSIVNVYRATMTLTGAVALAASFVDRHVTGRPCVDVAERGVDGSYPVPTPQVPVDGRSVDLDVLVGRYHGPGSCRGGAAMGGVAVTVDGVTFTPSPGGSQMTLTVTSNDSGSFTFSGLAAPGGGDLSGRVAWTCVEAV